MRVWISIVLLVLLSGCGLYVDGYGGGNGCFIAGTLISTPMGDAPIESLHVADKVYAWDEASDTVVESVVDDSILHKDLSPITISLDNGLQLRVTAEHPLYVANQKKWVPVSELIVGDSLKSIGKDHALSSPKITALSQETSVQDTYNLKVRRYQNSFAQGVLAHFY